jgi:prolipoprotein diacylglyceryltransferase
MLERYLTPWRIRWYSVSILFAIFLGFIICVFYGTGSETISGRLGGDYPAFYSIGRIVAKGDLEAIYNL